MGQSQSDLQLKQCPQPVISPILNLPIEISFAITSYLPISQLRIVCRHFDNLLFESFAERNFSQLDGLPTVNAVADLAQIAKTRLKPYVPDLRFWSTIYQHGKALEVTATSFVRQKPRTRIVKANDLPYPCPALS